MANAASLTCPGCGHTERPLRHLFKSSCGGAVGWQGGTLRCLDCGMKIYMFRCDRCGRVLDQDDVA